MGDDRTQLDYAPRIGRRRRVWLWRVGWVVVVIVLLAMAVPKAYRRVACLYYRHEASVFTAPGNRVVYEEDPGLQPALLRSPGYRLWRLNSPGWNPFVGYWVEPLAGLHAWEPNLGISPCALFSHARTSPSGQERLVVVWMPVNGIRPNAAGATPDGQVEIDVYASCLGKAACQESSLQEWIAPQSVAENRSAPLYLTIYAGQVDPVDASHFTIAYKLGEYSDVLDGYLMDNDRVVLFPRTHRVWEGLPQEKSRREWDAARAVKR